MDRPSASFFPTIPLPLLLRAADWNLKLDMAPWSWPTPTPSRGPESLRNWHGTATPWCRPQPWSKHLSAARQDAQAILLDTSLDGMNGWEILPLLRRMDASSRTPVVLLSVEDPENPKQLPAGADGLGFQAASRRRAADRVGARALRSGRKGAHPDRRRRSRPGQCHQRGLRPRQHRCCKPRTRSKKRSKPVPLFSRI